MTIVREFKIAKADEHIEAKLHIARMLPFTKTNEQAEALMRTIR